MDGTRTAPGSSVSRCPRCRPERTDQSCDVGDPCAYRKTDRHTLHDHDVLLLEVEGVVMALAELEHQMQVPGDIEYCSSPNNQARVFAYARDVLPLVRERLQALRELFPSAVRADHAPKRLPPTHRERQGLDVRYTATVITANSFINAWPGGPTEIIVPVHRPTLAAQLFVLDASRGWATDGDEVVVRLENESHVRWRYRLRCRELTSIPGIAWDIIGTDKG